MRAIVATTVGAVLFFSGADLKAGGKELLNKNDSLKEGDKGYMPGKGVEKLKEKFAQQFLKAITDHPHKVYKLKLKKGDKIVIDMKSKDMDSVVVVEDSKNTVLGFNDDDPAGCTLDSKLEFTAPNDDEYRIIATNLDKKHGDFQLTVSKAK
jgi:hypothetical protein